jgi:predicted porin
MWTVGLSASTGSYLRPFAEPTLARGHTLGDYRQTVVAGDAGFAWHHWQAWAEIYAARFAIPTVGNADTTAYYAELKYKFTPQFFGAVRWNQQFFADIPDRLGPTTWGRDTWRIDFAPGYRFTPHTQLKLQYSLTRERGGPDDVTSTAAAQFTLRF